MKAGLQSVTASDHLLAHNSFLHDEALDSFAKIFGRALAVALPQFS
jgi:hypothetical protein